MVEFFSHIIALQDSNPGAFYALVCLAACVLLLQFVRIMIQIRDLNRRSNDQKNKERAMQKRLLDALERAERRASLRDVKEEDS
jgi:hypothetical protein